MSFDLSKIGQLLRATREAKNLTFGHVSDALFIRKRVIEAIEAGKWENLPHEVYVRGYVIQYASFLGILDLVDVEQTLKKNEADVSVPRVTARPDRVSTSRWEYRRKVIGALGVAVIAGGFFVFQNIQSPVYTQPVPRQSAPVAEQVPYQPPQADYQTVALNRYEGQGDRVAFEAKKLMIACQQRTWVRIVIDGSEKKEFTMNPEEVVVLNGKEGFDLLIGNAAGVRLFYNGKDTGFAGEEGEVKRINLS